jgi:hypothetical protein
MLKQVGIEVTDATGKIGKIGRHWREGTTKFTLKPEDDPVLGTWEPDRPGDLDSGAKGLKRTYDFRTTNQTLNLITFLEKKKQGPNTIPGEPVRTVLTLDGFNIRTPSGTSGTGKFPFRAQILPVNWEVRVVVTDEPHKNAPPRPDKVFLGRRYRLQPNAPQIIKLTTKGFQVYEYYGGSELLYVGRSGGTDGQKPNNWVNRLEQSHITTEWIGEATKVFVTYDLTLPEAMALEEVLIPRAKYNRKPGEHSSQSPEGSTSANALSASKRGNRQLFGFELFPNPDEPDEPTKPAK